MKSLLAVILLVCSSPVFLATSCEHKKCPENTICTEMFAMVTVKVIDQLGNSVHFDEVYTIRKSNNETIRITQSMDGMLIVLDDSYQSKLKQDKDTFHIVGIKNGQKVLDEPYMISADCCHVSKVSGREEIKL